MLPALQANTLYENKYPLVAALSRPLITKKIVDLAHERGARVVAHGCTAKGNDQVRFDVSFRCLDPSLTILGPAREWGMNREEILDYCSARGINVPSPRRTPSPSMRICGDAQSNAESLKTLGRPCRKLLSPRR